jgi:PAS domain S-box-containing protein
MPQTAETDNNRMSLRERALANLAGGTRTDLKRDGMSNALGVLHRLASSQATAGDALALLHELQVHQVELDMQREELANSRGELEAALVRQTALLESAPAGFLTIDEKTVLCEINPAGARLLGQAREDLLGRPLAGLLSEPSTGTLHALLARAGEGLAPEPCDLRLLLPTGAQRTVHATAGMGTSPHYFQLVLMAAA